MRLKLGMRVVSCAQRIRVHRTIAITAVVSLMALTGSAWAQVPIFKLWVTEVYEVNPDGSYTPKCGATCPTQDLLPGIAQVGDLINIEVTVEGWDASTDSGECHPEGEVCSVSAQDCVDSHCSGTITDGICTNDSECFLPDTCDPDRCEKTPLLGGYQWTIDSSTYSNGGAAPGLAPAQLPCTENADCACAYTQGDPPGGFNDCADFAACCGFCTCVAATCDDNTCSREAAAYIDTSPIPNYVFSSSSSFAVIDVSTPDYAFGAFSTDGVFQGVPEELFRCSAGSRPICNVDADCPEGTCELVAASPYYLGTLLLEATGASCGLFTLDLVQDLLQGVAIATSLIDSNAEKLPNPIVETLFIDLGASAPCDDGDPCTENDLFCGGECAGTPIVCEPGEMCVAGLCQSEDCNGNGIADGCDIDCGPPGGPCDIPGCGQSEECTGNGKPDECDTPVCGDGCLMGIEECDDAGESAACDVDCTLVECGDGTLNATAGEACDEGLNNSDTEPNACRTTCVLPSCGDGVVDTDESCDDGLNNSDTEPDACRTDCRQAGCGDDVVDIGEECDDGNTEPGDDCDENCLFEPGACCLGVACNIATEADCLDSGGIFFGINTTCDAPDADGDGLRDECDGCPADASKFEPGICGCGVDDSADLDDDGVPDCEDLCPGSDDNVPGARDDDDDDGVLNCNDICPGADDAVFGDCTGTIPTVSVWGLLILALLLLAGSKVVFRNRLRGYRLP